MADLRTLVLTTPSDTEIVLTRRFDATRELVFDALTKPELIKRWFGPPPEYGWTVAVCEGELVVGGASRIVLRRGAPTPAEMVMRSVYREFARPARFVTAQSVEGCEVQGSSEVIVTTVLTDLGGATLFTSTLRFPTKSVRDAVLRSGGRQASMAMVYDKLAAVLAAPVPTTSEGA